ncbi:MAG: cadherin domain-containing protein, partial [Candidatus Poribacteria bacterium]|nr:cadherin domain-containing protein [Candidatus Poribacteria bacterium]
RLDVASVTVEASSPPVFSDDTSTTRSIAENTAPGIDIGSPISATDPDGDTLTYSLSGTDASSFSIVSTSGQLQTSAALDYETKTSYSVTITVSDGSLTDSITVTIKVTDVDETPTNNAPVFSEGTSATRSVAENTASGTNIGNAVAATDADDDTLTYTLGGTDAASFSIVSTSGQLQTSTSLDYETKNSYSVTVSVSDGNGGSDSITVTINVTDVSETRANDPPTNNAPEFTEGTSTTRTVAENTASGTNIGSAVSATDADDDTLTYTLGGTDASSFSIVSTSGQLQTSGALDYETKTSYSVTVSVSDGNGGSDSITVTINVAELIGTSIINTNITTCSIIHKSGDVYDVTIAGTLTASQSVRSLTVYGYVNSGSQIGTDSIGFLDAGETVNFSITATWTHDGSTSQRCSTILVYQKIPSGGNNAPVAQLVPSETILLPNYPNPFNPETWIPYQLAKPAEVTLTIYNMRGVVVRQLKLGHKAAGMYTSRSRAIHWDGRNMFGEKVAAGVYFYTLKAGDFTATRKMLIRK